MKSSSSRRCGRRSGAGIREKGQFRDVHPATLLAADLYRGARTRRRRGREGRRRARGLRAAVRRAVVQHRPERVAPGRSAVRDPGDDDRPPVRLGPAGGQLRRHADRERRPRRHDRLGRRVHGPDPDVRRAPVRGRGRLTVHARAARSLQADRPGLQRRDDRGAVEPLARAARRDRRPLAAARRARGRRKGASTARSSRSPSTAASSPPTRASARARRPRASPSSSRPSRRTA